jgi:predicted GNAT superfamily acetyltransferase
LTAKQVGRENGMGVIRFRYDVPLEETMEFEAVYPEPLQFDLAEKEEVAQVPGTIFVWLYVDGKIVGESYGIPLATTDWEFEGLTELNESEKKRGIYCHSNTILPAFQRTGFGKILKAHWLGLVAGAGFDFVYGHARPGASQALNAKFGAEFIERFADWYGTGEEYRLYRLQIR